MFTALELYNRCIAVKTREGELEDETYNFHGNRTPLTKAGLKDYTIPAASKIIYPLDLLVVL